MVGRFFKKGPQARESLVLLVCLLVPAASLVFSGDRKTIEAESDCRIRVQERDDNEQDKANQSSLFSIRHSAFIPSSQLPTPTYRFNKKKGLS